MCGLWSIYESDQVLSDKVHKALLNLKKEKLVKKVIQADQGDKGGKGEGPRGLSLSSNGLGVLIRALARCPTKLSVNK